MALTLFFFVCQPALLEDYVSTDANRISPDNEGRLVYAHGDLGADEAVVDPLYGVRSKGMGLWREVTPTTPSSTAPPEDFLQRWGDAGAAPARLGCYMIEGECIPFPMFHQHVSFYSLTPQMREIADAQPDGKLLVHSSNGVAYKVHFLTRKSANFNFLGRQRGNMLVQDEAAEIRQHMIENQPPPKDAGWRLLRKVGFILPIAWLLFFLGLWALWQGAVRRAPMWSAVAASAFGTLALIAGRVQQCISAGALVRFGSIWQREWKHDLRLFDADRAAAWNTASTALACLCLALAILLPAAIELRRRKQITR